MTDYVLTQEEPTPDEYVRLRIDAGLSRRSIDAARVALPNSLCIICVRHDQNLVGMGRIVGDGGCNYEIVDVAVHPEYQRRGLGYKIMSSLMEYLHSNAPESAYVSLIADEGAPTLYEKFGFKPTAPASIGMALVI